MAPGALAGWLIPSEFMDVNYGAAVKRYLLDRVTLLHIHRFDPNDVQFGDALVSSSVVWFRNETPSNDYGVRMTYGGSLLEPGVERAVPASELRGARKWTRYPTWSADGCEDAPTLRRFFTVKRGLATGHNRFFILPEEEIARRGLPWQVFRPILPGPRHLAGGRGSIATPTETRDFRVGCFFWIVGFPTRRSAGDILRSGRIWRRDGSAVWPGPVHLPPPDALVCPGSAPRRPVRMPIPGEGAKEGTGGRFASS